jgi:DNA-binding response OmpR family regulator
MRILLIEDDKKIAAGLRKGLKAEGFAIYIASDGQSGEEMTAVNDYDAILLDILLPGQNGWQTCANLRRDKILTPILMLTALDDVSDKIKGLEQGADDYLAKPFHFGELVARIRALIRRQSEVRSSVLEIYGLQLDTSTQGEFWHSCQSNRTHNRG